MVPQTPPRPFHKRIGTLTKTLSGCVIGLAACAAPQPPMNISPQSPEGLRAPATLRLIAPADVVVGVPTTLAAQLSHAENGARATFLAGGRDLCGTVVFDASGWARCQTSLLATESLIQVRAHLPAGAPARALQAVAEIDILNNGLPWLIVDNPPAGVLPTWPATAVRIRGGDPDDASENLAIHLRRDGADEPPVFLHGGVAEVLLGGEPGEHRLELRLVDSQGAEAQTTLRWYAGAEDLPPECAILTEGGNLPNPVNLAATATDPDDPPVDLTATWTSDRQGAIFIPTSDEHPDPYGYLGMEAVLEPGRHTITLRVTDPWGLDCTDQQIIDVEE
jgi:hypothetical protein